MHYRSIPLSRTVIGISLGLSTLGIVSMAAAASFWRNDEAIAEVLAYGSGETRVRLESGYTCNGYQDLVLSGNSTDGAALKRVAMAAFLAGRSVDVKVDDSTTPCTCSGMKMK